MPRRAKQRVTAAQMARPAAATASTNKPRLRWNYEMRLVLHLLFPDRTLSAADRGSIFNNVFESDIKKCGFAGDIPYSALTAQRGDLRPKDWAKITASATTADETNKREVYKSKIQSLRDDTKWLGVGPATAALDEYVTGTTKQHAPADESLLGRPLALAQVQILVPMKISKQMAPRETVDTEASLDQHAQEEAPAGRTSLRRRVTSFEVPSRLHLSRRVPVPIFDDERSEDDQPPLKRHRQDARPFLRFARPESEAPPPMRTPKAPRKFFATVPYPRPGDQQFGRKPLLITPEELELSKKPLVPVSSELAHPPLHGLLYRVWYDTPGQHHDSRIGHTARKCSLQVPLGPSKPPRCDRLDWKDVLNHLNVITSSTWPSQYISLTNIQVWAVRRAVKGARDTGNTGGFISVIAAERLDPKAVYHAHPYHKQLVRKLAFDGGAWRYNAFHEFLVWEDVPARAILKTIRVSDIIVLGEDKSLGPLLRLNMVSRAGDYKTVILPQLKAMNVLLCPATAAVIARFAHEMGLDASANSQHISHFVSDMVQGWALLIRRNSDQEWARFAAVFARGLENASGLILRSSESERLELAFLDGVRYGSSRHWNCMHKTELVRLMQRQAKMIGLEDPAQLLEGQSSIVRSGSRALQLNVESLLRGQPTQIQRVQRRAIGQYEMMGKDGFENAVRNETEDHEQEMTNDTGFAVDEDEDDEEIVYDHVFKEEDEMEWS